jgi:urate oxidase
MAELQAHTYGKTGVRLTQVLRNGGRHEVVELDVSILFEGEFGETYLTGDNSKVLPTDTMKNTVYVVASQNPVHSIEQFSIHLSEHFLSRLDHLHQVTIEIHQTPWNHIGNHDAAFEQTGGGRRYAKLVASRSGKQLVSGLRSLEILKTSRSAFLGFLKDEYTSLPETHDRLFGTVLDADWSYGCDDAQEDHNRLAREIRQTLLDCFARHESLSVQHTLFAMGHEVLNQFDAIGDIHLVMPNKHRLLFDLGRWGMKNTNEIFVPTDEPSGYIEARLKR